MTSVNQLIEVEWLIACLSPGDIAPHPNFSAEGADGPELLALIVQFQWHEYSTYRDLLDEDDSSFGANVDLPDAVRLALDSVTRNEGLQRLISIAEDRQMSLGKRAAAAILAATINSEIDRPDANQRLLHDLATEIGRDERGARGSRALAEAILLQQVAFRAKEAGRAEDALEHSQMALVKLDVTEPWDSFRTSRGIGWDSQESQRRLVELTRQNALSTIVSLRGFSDDSWKDLVRAPIPAADARFTAYAFTALASVVDEEFKGEHVGLKKSRTFGRNDATMRNLYSTLLHAELAGDSADTARMRTIVGEVLSLRLDDIRNDDDSHTEAIRLLRQGDSEDHLARLLQTIRMQGPLKVLRASAEALIDGRRDGGIVTTSDLVLLERAYDLIGSVYCMHAIQIALRYVDQEHSGRVKSSKLVKWKRLETTLRVVSVLTGNLGGRDVARVAQMVLDLAASTGLTVRTQGLQFIFKALAEFISSVNWREVPADLQGKWLTLTDELAGSRDILYNDYLRAIKALGGRSVVERDRFRGSEFVAALVGGLLDESQRSRDVSRSVRLVSELLRTMRNDATHGKYVAYGYPPMPLASYLVTEFEAEELWPDIVEAITDPLVPSEEKTASMEILTAYSRRRQLPSKVAKSLMSRPLPWKNISTAAGIFEVSTEQLDAVTRTFYLAFGLVPLVAVRESILRDAASPDVTVRVEVARACLHAAAKGQGYEWPEVLLLQLSHDRNSRVRTEASRALGYLSVLAQLPLGTAVRERVESLLCEPGIAVPLGALKGILSTKNDHVEGRSTSWCRTIIESLSADHPSRSVQATAREALAD